MLLPDYLKTLTPTQREAYAERCGTTDAYLSQLAGDHRKPGWQLTQLLSKESGNVVQLHEIRPDIFGDPAASSPAAMHCS